MSAAKRKYKPYPKYKDSGVEWLGRVPEHWDIKPIWAVADCNTEKLRDDEEPDTEIDYVDISAVTYEGGILSSQPLLFANAPSRARRRAEKGDIAISTVRTYLKAVAEVTEEFAHCVFSTGFAVIHPKQQVHQPFLRWIIPSGSFVSAVESHSEGVSYPAINAADLMKLKIVLPPNSDCQSIADFIERECGRMDKLVEKKQEFITLLKEKRQALITHAVTKGLNPKAVMKDSGVEWLGKVPKHWRVEKYAWHFKSAMGQTILQSDLVEGGEYPVYSATESGAIFGHIDNPSVRLDIGDIVIPARGISIGYPVKVPGKATTTQTTIYSKPRNQNVTSTAYTVYYLMGYRPVLFYFDRTAIPQITVDQVNFNPILIPPKDEAKVIADHIDRETTRIDRLIAKTLESIALLKERKTSLITAAVTGQIDVSQSA